MRDWRASFSPASEGSSFYVLRHRQQLEEIVESIRHRSPLPQTLPDDAIIQIQLQLLSRGHVKDNALICLPTAADHKKRWRQLKHNDQALFTWSQRNRT